VPATDSGALSSVVGPVRTRVGVGTARPAAPASLECQRGGAGAWRVAPDGVPAPARAGYRSAGVTGAVVLLADGLFRRRGFFSGDIEGDAPVLQRVGLVHQCLDVGFGRHEVGQVFVGRVGAHRVAVAQLAGAADLMARIADARLTAEIATGAQPHDGVGDDVD